MTLIAVYEKLVWTAAYRATWPEAINMSQKMRQRLEFTAAFSQQSPHSHNSKNEYQRALRIDFLLLFFFFLLFFFLIGDFIQSPNRSRHQPHRLRIGLKIKYSTPRYLCDKENSVVSSIRLNPLRAATDARDFRRNVYIRNWYLYDLDWCACAFSYTHRNRNKW